MRRSRPSRTTRGRREGRELAAPMAPVRKECTGQEPQVRPRHPGLPCAMALRIIRDLPGDRLSCPHRPRVPSSNDRGLDLSVERPGPHDFSVRADCARLAQPSRPSPPTSTYRDDAYVPLHEAGWQEISTLSEKAKGKFCCVRGMPDCLEAHARMKAAPLTQQGVAAAPRRHQACIRAGRPAGDILGSGPIELLAGQGRLDSLAPQGDAGMSDLCLWGNLPRLGVC